MQDFILDCAEPQPTPRQRATFGSSLRRMDWGQVRAEQNAWIPDETRFGNAVVRLPNGCWAFNGELDTYGQFCRSTESGLPAENVKAHRYAYETLVGPIPADFHVHHECLNPGCVNPTHLMALSPGDHQRRHAEIRRAAA